jgi:hypothetical protein
MPARPQARPQRVRAAFGMAEVKVFVAEREPLTCVAEYFDLPARLVRQRGAARILASQGIAFARGFQPKSLRQRALQLGGTPGRELEFEAPGGVVYRARAYLVNRRLYQIFAGASRAQAQPEQFARFLDSFTLLEGC